MEIPVTNVVIKAIEAMANNQGFKNLKFKNRHGVIFHDADWLAGVDYEDEDEEECEENADEDEEYEDSEEQDIELEEAENIDPGEINDIIEDEANPNEHQDAGEHQEDDGDHQESEENIGIEELSGEEPGVPPEYRAMMNRVSDDLDVVMNYTNASNHVPEAEQNNHKIKERIRETFQRLPYKAIPCIMIQYLAMVSGMQLNFFPTKGGVSTYYSLWMIMDQTNSEYTKHCTMPFGA